MKEFPDRCPECGERCVHCSASPERLCGCESCASPVEEYVSELAKYPALYPRIPVEAIASQQARAGYVD